MALLHRFAALRVAPAQMIVRANAARFASTDITIKSDPSLAKELNDNMVSDYDLVADLNAKYPDKGIRWAGCNTWRTLEWILPHPPPFHTFEEQPLIKETVGAATVTPRPPNYNPAADDPMEHSYHPAVHQTL